MTRKPAIRKRAGERGQTLALVAMSLVVLIAVAALAIDTTTLYVARTEAQRAADAAALAGARAFVDSGTTTDPADTDLPLLAQALAGNSNNTGYMGAVLQQNKVGGVVPDLTATFDFHDSSRQSAGYSHGATHGFADLLCQNLRANCGDGDGARHGGGVQLVKSGKCARPTLCCRWRRAA